MSYADDVLAKHKKFEAEKIAQKEREQKIRDSIRPLLKNEKPKADEYVLPGVCANCKYEGSMAIRKGVDVSGSHKFDHFKNCPSCGAESFSLPDPLAKIRFHLNKAEAHRDVFKITRDDDDRRKTRAHLAMASSLLDNLRAAYI